MHVAARVAVKAVHGGDFFFPKLDGVAQLLPSSSDGVDDTYGCETTLSLVLGFKRPKRRQKIRHEDRLGLGGFLRVEDEIGANPRTIYRGFGTNS
jgi:hypothetical protein